jgi:hypothetical protein
MASSKTNPHNMNITSQVWPEFFTNHQSHCYNAGRHLSTMLPRQLPDGGKARLVNGGVTLIKSTGIATEFLLVVIIGVTSESR